MHRLSILLAVVPCLGFGLSAQARCWGGDGAGDWGPGCGQPTAMHLSPAAEGHPPLIWSSNRGTLVSPPVGEAWHAGRTIPTGEVIGLKIAPVGGLPEPIVYNRPGTYPNAVEPGVVLMPVLQVRHPAKVRGEYP